jgi:hypothetical protein
MYNSEINKSIPLKLEKNKNNPFGFKFEEFNEDFLTVKKRTPLEYENDKKIFETAERGHNGCYLLNIEAYNRLSKQTQHESSNNTKYMGEYVSISDSVIFP